MIQLSNRLSLLLALLGPALASAQTATLTTFRVSTDPPGAQIAVDGTSYTTAATFQWPVGSKHTVQFLETVLPAEALVPSDPTQPVFSAVQLAQNGAVIYGLDHWVDAAGVLLPNTSTVIAVTADPSVPSLTAKITIGYRVLLALLDSRPVAAPTCTAAPGAAPPDLRGGLVYINNNCYWNSALLYFPAGTVLSLNAFPYPGFVFNGWSDLPSSGFLQSLTLSGPMSLIPRFELGKRVRFLTTPPGLQVLVDRTVTLTNGYQDPSRPCPVSLNLPVSSPPTIPQLCIGDYDFAPDSQHLVGAPTPQMDQTGKLWVFDHWGNGLGQNAIYKTDEQTSVSDQVTVSFLQGGQASFLTVPGGLKLTVDGRDNWPAYNFVWGIGSVHSVTAPASELDASGRKYTFLGWSGGGTNTQSVTMDQTAVDSGFRMIANFSVLSRVVVQSSPPGQHLVVDGADCLTPCNVDKNNAAQIHVTAPTSIAIADGVRLDFSSWSDSGSADHLFTIAADTQTLTASYTTLNRLSATSDPANGVDYQFNPSSPDTFYPADTPVTITATAKGGFKFRRWGGDLSGTYPSGVVQLSNGPHAVVALLDRVPYIAPTGVSNAAGQTPDAVVAAGSLIAISGESLAPDTVQGPANPLTQALDGLSVTVGDRILPLVSVSPQQVIAQLPSNLPPGDYTLQVHSTGQPDVNGSFTIVRNAPGVFSTTSNSNTYLMANHADGTAVTPDSPAQQGETITIFGTGFGPYSSLIFDGFFPFNPPPSLADPVDVLAGDQVLQPVSVTAAAGYTGMVALQLTIPSSLPTGTTIPLQVRINSRLSNTVQLPLQ